MSLLAAMTGLALAGQMVQGPLIREEGGLGWLTQHMTAYDLAGLDETQRVDGPCEDRRLEPDGAWPFPLGGMARLPGDSGRLVAADARRADCFYLYEPASAVFEAVPIRLGASDVDVRLPGADAGTTARLTEAVLGPNHRFRARGDVQSVLVEPLPRPFFGHLDPNARVPVARLTLLGSGVPTTINPLAGDGNQEAVPLDRPGALFVTQVDLDAHGRPIGAGRAWPLWAWIFGETDTEKGTLSMPGDRRRYDHRERASLDLLGFEPWPGDGTPQPPRALSDLPMALLDNAEALAPVLPVGITELAWLETSVGELERMPAVFQTLSAVQPDPVVSGAMLVAPGRSDRMPWMLGDLAGWPVVSALSSPVVGIGVQTPSDLELTRWGAVLQHTGTPVDQLSQHVQADAVVWQQVPGGAEGEHGMAVRIGTAGALDNQALIAAMERDWPRNRPVRDVPWSGRANSLRSFVAAGERATGRIFGRNVDEMRDVVLPQGSVPPLPLLSWPGKNAWLQRWRMSINGATRSENTVWLGLGDPVDENGWHAVLLGLPANLLRPVALDNVEAVDVARAWAREEVAVVRFTQHWRLFDPLPVRWKEKRDPESQAIARERAAALTKRAKQLESAADAIDDKVSLSVAEDEKAQRLHARSRQKATLAKDLAEPMRVHEALIPYWSDDFLRFLYRFAPERVLKDKKNEDWCAPNRRVPVSVTAIACRSNRLPDVKWRRKQSEDGDIKWWQKHTEKSTIETHAPAYARNVAYWLSYQKARRHVLLGARYAALQQEQRRRARAIGQPRWTERTVQTVLQPQVGALLSGSAPSAPDTAGVALMTEAVARIQATTLPLPRPEGDLGRTTRNLPWPAEVTITHRADGTTDVSTSPHDARTVAVDHRMRTHIDADGTKIRYITAWCLLTSSVLSDLARIDENAADELEDRAGDLVLRTLVLAGTGEQQELLDVLPSWSRTAPILDVSERMDALTRYDAERFRKRSHLLTASTWESRWLHRSPNTRILGTSGLTPESKQAQAVQSLLGEQNRWPGSARGLEKASSMEIIDQDNVLVVAMGGQPGDLRGLGVPVPISFVEIPLVPDLAFRGGARPADPLVLQSRLPWLSTPQMRPSEIAWLSHSVKGTARCMSARDHDESGPGTPHYNNGPCLFRIGDLQYDPDSRALVLSTQEPEGTDTWLFYLATLDQAWFSPLATVPVPDGTPLGTVPLLARRLDASGRALIGLQRATTLPTPVSADFHWLVTGAIVTEAERQRVAPCLDPSDPRCNLP
jgi:hypothetical protein